MRRQLVHRNVEDVELESVSADLLDRATVSVPPAGDVPFRDPMTGILTAAFAQRPSAA